MSNIIIYNTQDGETSVSLLAKDGMVWMSQMQIAELFATTKQNISLHIQNILEEKELEQNSVVKEYLTTANDGKNYSVTHYSLEMILAIGFRVRSKRGTQFRQWANKNLKEYMIKGFIKKLENFLPLVAIMMQVINQLNYFLHKLKINYCLLSQDKQQQRLL